MLFSVPPHPTDVNCEDKSTPENPRVFLDIAIDGRPAAERLVIELFANVVPKTAENFRALCTGEKSTPEKSLHYKGTVFNFICKDLYAQGGDILNVRGGASIYGEHFEDENHELLHSEPGMLSMCGFRPNANGSSFFITFRPFRGFDRIHVVFGKIIDGMGTLYKIDQMGTHTGKPSGVVEIINCGELKNNVMQSPEGEIEKALVGASSSDGKVEELSVEKKKIRSKSSEVSEDKKKKVIESDKGEKKRTRKEDSSSDWQGEELSDERKKKKKKQRKSRLITDSGEVSEDKKNKVMEFDKGEKKKTLKGVAFSDGQVEKLSDEGKKKKKRRKSRPSEGKKKKKLRSGDEKKRRKHPKH